MLRIVKSVTVTLFAWDHCFYVERKREWKIWFFTITWWQVLSRQNTAIDAARFAANIQRYTNEELTLWF